MITHRRMRGRPHAVVALSLVSLVAAGCFDDRPPDDPLINSESHWLQPCDEDAECGGARCICHVCTTECVADDACAQPGEGGGICLAPASDAQHRQCDQSSPAAQGICLAPCEVDVDCLEETARCFDGACISPPGCLDDKFWDIDGAVIEFEGAPLTLEFDERGRPADLAVRICKPGDALEEHQAILTGVGPWEGQLLFEQSITPTPAGSSCTLWITIGVPDPPVTPGARLEGDARAITPPECAGDYGFECAPQVATPCGTCAIAPWSVTRGCHP